jgi:hypothetical protein
MFGSPYFIFWLATGFLLGLTFLYLISDRSSTTKIKKVRINHQAQRVKLYLSITTLSAVAIISWFVQYIGTNENWDPIVGEISSAIFGVATAGLLGGIIFEMFLRKDILSETSEILADIVTTDKSVAQEVFTKEKRCKIIEMMMQLNTGNDVYGSALYQDFVARYTDETLGYNNEFRFDFEDSVTFFDIDPESHSELSSCYFEVIDSICFRTYLSEYINQEYFIFGCAENEENLYKFFNDSKCLYRWLLKTTKFNELLFNMQAFGVTFSIDGHEYQPLEAKMTDRGFEIHFPNPLIKERQPDSSFIERIIEIKFETRSLHPKTEGFLSIHLAYPVKGAEINFDFENAKSINNVTKLHFLTAGKITPRIEEGVSSHMGTSKAQRRNKVKISNDHWLFPDSGVIFVWELLKE